MSTIISPQSRKLLVNLNSIGIYRYSLPPIRLELRKGQIGLYLTCHETCFSTGSTLGIFVIVIRVESLSHEGGGQERSRTEVEQRIPAHVTPTGYSTEVPR